MAVPKLRFKADDGSQFPEWEEKKLGEYLIQYTEKTTVNNQYPVLTSSRKGIYLQDDYYGRQVASENNIGYNIVPYGYFTYRHMSDDLIFRFNINNIVEKGIVSTLYPVFTVTDKIDSNFLQSYLNESIDFFKYCMLQKQGGSRTYMYFGKLKDFVAHLPCLPEQQKIAEFLSTIDTVIAKQKETVSAWEERKKGVMQKLFSQEVRFKADDGSKFPEWEEKKIDDLFYKVNERNNGQFGKDKWISVAKMYYQDEDKVTSNNIDTRTYVMRVGDMSFEGHPNKEFKYGRFVVNDIGDGIISELFPIYRHKENYILKYWKYAIQVYSIMQKIYRKSITSSGASSNKLDDDDFKRQSILVPCLAEQRKIADCLSSFDEVIEKQKATLAAWEELKKGLLQQMFV